MGALTLAEPCLLIQPYDRPAREVFEIARDALSEWLGQGERLVVSEASAPTILTARVHGAQTNTLIEVGITPGECACRLGVRISGKVWVPGLVGGFTHEPHIHQRLQDKLRAALESAEAAFERSLDTRDPQQKLRLLEHLVGEGLITRDEYARKRKQLVRGR